MALSLEWLDRPYQLTELNPYAQQGIFLARLMRSSFVDGVDDGPLSAAKLSTYLIAHPGVMGPLTARAIRRRVAQARDEVFRDRLCKGCDRPLAASRRRGTRYCRDRPGCRKRAHRRRLKARRRQTPPLASAP